MRIIRLAASAIVTNKPLEQWLARSIPTRNVPKLHAALGILVAMGNARDINPYMISTNWDNLSIIVFLGTLNGERSFQSLLGNYIPIITDVSNFDWANPAAPGTTIKCPPASLPPASVIADINDIIATIGANYGTRTTQEPMKNALLVRFKTFLTGAASAEGNAALASSISSSNTLTDVRAIIDAYPNQKLTPLPFMFSVSNKLVRDIMSKRYDLKAHPEFVAQNFQIVKEELMKPLGTGIGAKQREQSKVDRATEEYNRISNPASTAPGAPPPTMSLEQAKPIAVDSKHVIDPFFVLSLFIFFTEYSKAIIALPP